MDAMSFVFFTVLAVRYCREWCKEDDVLTLIAYLALGAMSAITFVSWVTTD